ncbi:MAG: MerR family transcriptional regulator [Cyanobacteriota bacterium]
MEISPFPAAGDPAGSSDEAFGLEELLLAAGERLGEEINSRTVRLYATQGLIDRPDKEGRHAVYGRRHLLQLLLIRSLARHGLSLSAIAPLVAFDDRELEQQLAQVDESGTTGASNPALAYLQSLKAPAAESSQSLLPLLGGSIASSLPPRSALTGSRSSGGSRQAATRWHRFSLAPGVELHLSESASIPPPGSRRQAWLLRLLERLREQLDTKN